MIKVVILGFGNVGQHLYHAFSKNSEIDIIQIYNRSQINFPEGFQANFTTVIPKLKEADIYIITVPDDVINILSETLPFKNKLVVHTSGSVPLNKLSEKKQERCVLPFTNIFKKCKSEF